MIRNIEKPNAFNTYSKVLPEPSNVYTQYSQSIPCNHAIPFSELVKSWIYGCIHI